MTEPTGDHSFTINTDGRSTVQAIQTITAGRDVTVNFAAQESFDQSDLRPGRSPGEIERTAELARLDGWRRSQGDRWAVIVGPGGAGKSTLASQWFDRSQSGQSWAGRLWTDLGRGQGFAEVARRAIVQFGTASPEAAERLEESELSRLLLLKLQQSPCLWVLDNLETVLEGRELPADYREFWEQWRSCRGAAGWVLFTSRDAPTGMGTRRIDLAEGFSPEQGARFLRDRGVRGAEAELRAFSAQVHGYPLILGLAAGFLVTQCDADPHLSKLPADFFAIADRHRNDPQATLETVLQWSFDRLPPELRDWLGRLCALRVAFALETEDHPNLLPELAGRSFLIQDCLPLTDPDAPRQFVYRWQPIVQQFVQRQQPDLIEAHRFAIAHHDRRYVGLGKWQTKADINNYIEDWHHEGELAKLTGDRQGEAISLDNLGLAYRSLGQSQQAIDFHEQSLAIDREIGDRQGEATSLNNLGLAYRSLGQSQQAIDFYEQSLAIDREIGDRSGEGGSLCNLGNAYDSLGQFQQAIHFYEQALVICREAGHREFTANSLGGLGNAYRSLGQYQRAIADLASNTGRSLARSAIDKEQPTPWAIWALPTNPSGNSSRRSTFTSNPCRSLARSAIAKEKPPPWVIWALPTILSGKSSGRSTFTSNLCRSLARLVIGQEKVALYAIWAMPTIPSDSTSERLTFTSKL